VSGTYLGLRGSEKRNYLISRVLVCAHVARWGKKFSRRFSAGKALLPAPWCLGQRIAQSEHAGGGW